MTLLISCLTHEHVIQVSDRKVVWVNARHEIEQVDDDRNKAVNYCRRFAFGYAGLAEIEPGVRTDIWLARSLGQIPRQSIETAAESIRAKATKKFQNWQHLDPRVRRNAFVGVGWAIPFGEEEICPVFINISNCHDVKGNELSSALDEFTLGHSFLNVSARGAINVTGRQLPPRVFVTLRRELRQFAKKKVSPRLVVDRIAATIREIATDCPDVGTNLMALCIPKRSLETKSPFYVEDTPSWDIDTFVYLPSGRDEYISYMPNYVCGGTALTDGMVRTSGTETDISVRIG